MNWLNTKKIINENLNKEKPCHKLGWCPYGQLVEEFGFSDDEKISCKLFGHDCPMFYHAEDVSEDKKEEITQRVCERERSEE